MHLELYILEAIEYNEEQTWKLRFGFAKIIIAFSYWAMNYIISHMFGIKLLLWIKP